MVCYHVMSDSAHLIKFNRVRLSGRQISELLGLCRGLIADGKIVQSEAESLYAWLIDQEGMGHSLVEAMRTRVGQMLEDGVLDADESAELMRLVRGLIDNRLETEAPLNRDGVPTNRLDDYQLSALLGLCRGLIADGKIDQSEADTLHIWLAAHEGTIDNPVMKAFQEQLIPFRNKKVEDNDNNLQLIKLLDGLVGGKTEVGECLRATVLWLDDPPPEVIFENRKFCLTGKFSRGKRNRCDDEIRSRRGICQSSPSKTTDYLVIGSYAEGAWIQSAFGRKIEKAVELRAMGLPVRIISEAHWLASLEQQASR